MLAYQSDAELLSRLAMFDPRWVPDPVINGMKYHELSPITGRKYMDLPGGLLFGPLLIIGLWLWAPTKIAGSGGPAS